MVLPPPYFKLIHFNKTVQFDKITILLRSHEHIIINHNHTNWIKSYRNINNDKPKSADLDTDETQSNQSVIYRFTIPREKKTSNHSRLSAPSNYTGINSIEVDMKLKTVKITVTSKLLADPSQMLTKDNFYYVWEAINDTQLLKINNVIDVQASAGILAADVTIDSIMSTSVSSYIKVLGHYYTGRKYNRVHYSHNILWQSVAKGKRSQRSLTLYDKNKETNNNNVFAPNTLRMELRLNALALLRKYLMINTIEKEFVSLESALSSTCNPVSIAFQEVLGDMQNDIAKAITSTDETTIYDETIFVTGLDMRKEGIFWVLKRAEFNLDVIRARLRGDKNASRRLAPYKDMLTEWLAKNSVPCQDLILLKELIFSILESGIPIRPLSIDTTYAPA